MATTATHEVDHLNIKSVIGKDGSFIRPDTVFRNTIEPGSKFEPEKGRYHLYVSPACPWASRALIVRKLKGLEETIGVTFVSPYLGTESWPFNSAHPFPGAEDDPHENATHIRDLYHIAFGPGYKARFSVPVLWDTKLRTIVNNESAEIIRIFNSAFNHILAPEDAKVDLYPAEHHAEIDEINDWVYNDVNNGVYKSGLAQKQEAYEAVVTKLFAALDKLEARLNGKEYLIGVRLTEADIRLYVTLIRFDVVYHGHFKCNIKDIRHGYPNLHRWLRDLYWKNEAFKSTTYFDHIKVHYYWSQTSVNPTRVVPVGPVPDIEPL